MKDQRITRNDINPHNDDDLIKAVKIVIATIKRDGRLRSWSHDELLSEAWEHAPKIRDNWSPEKGDFMRYLFASLPFRISDGVRFFVGHKRNPDRSRNAPRFVIREQQITEEDDDKTFEERFYITEDQQDYSDDFKANYDWDLLNEQEINCIELKLRGLSLKQIGLSLGLSESRICQVIKNIRRKWADYCPEEIK